MSNEIKAAIAEHGQLVKTFKQQTEESQSQLASRLQLVEQMVASQDGMHSGFKGFAPNLLANTLLQSDQLQSMRQGANSTGQMEMAGIGIKSLVSAGRGDGDTTTYNTGVDRAGAGFYGVPQPRLSLLEALPVLPVHASVFEYLRNDGYQNLAATQVVEGSVKQKTDLPTEVVQAQIATIAHWITASTQVLSDDAALTMQLAGLMEYGVLQKLENEIINGTGGSGKIAGLLDQGTAFVPSVANTDMADIVGEAVTQLYAIGWQPDLIVMSPADWFALISKKDNEERYLIGDPSNPAPLSLWNTPVVLSAHLTAGTALVMDTSQTLLLDREAPVLIASRSDSDNLTRNLVTLLAEMRAGLAVTATSAVLKITLE